MSRHFDRYTAIGSQREPKLDLHSQVNIDMDLVHKTDIGKIPVRINKTTIILKKK